MALIALDISSTGGVVTASTNSWSHTCTGTNRILFVGTSGNTSTCTGITYNGVAMTSIGTTSTGSNNAALFYLINPASGSNTIQVTYSGSNTFGAHAISYTSAQQFGVPDASNTNSNSGVTSISASVTTVLNNCWLVCAGDTSASDASAGANTTLRQVTGNASRRTYMGDSNSAQTIGSHSQNVTCSSGGNTMIVASFAPSFQTLSLSLTVGTFNLTGFAVILSKIKTIALSVGVFNLTGRAVTFGRMSWHTVQKHVSSWTDGTKHASSVTNQTKHSSTWTEPNKSL